MSVVIISTLKLYYIQCKTNNCWRRTEGTFNIIVSNTIRSGYLYLTINVARMYPVCNGYI